MISPLAITVAIAILGLVAWVNYKSHGQRPFPPGPPRKWLVGNTLDFPNSRPWITFRDWCNRYGNLVFVDLPFKPIVLIGSVEVAKDLLETRSNIYSDRPYSPMIELVKWDWAIATMPYTSEWRTRRRHFRQLFGRPALHQYHDIQLQETHSMLAKILDNPAQARQHIRSLPGSSIIRAVYGPRDASQMREYVRTAELALESARILTVPGAFLAELIPSLKYIPDWLPGGSARRFAKKYKPILEEMKNKAFDEVKSNMAEGKAVDSAAYKLIRTMQDDQGNMTNGQDVTARCVAASAYAGAADTTTAGVEAFVCAMAMHPEAQKKAQDELDRVVGPTRLPDFGDLESLIYVRAIMLETLRWIPTAPLGLLPRRLMEDDLYNGYYLPKGTIVIPNIWAMLHNPKDYPGPETFRPERFLDEHGNISLSVRDPTTIVFGFGRRICAGADFALVMLNITIASMLHVFEVKAGVDEHGQPLVLASEGTDEGISSPMTFPRHIKPRSAQAERLIGDIVLAEQFC
ncbi:cytochrome P450 [Cristinia sonorae]|uniref:Cytochrome P450 n=1 Tax=Cristinia sonorae TaxID=1940300 RepID=A0A8K0UW61_9AGAR|nr:cytochrome P450 [Cristinia sonorae]